MEYQGPSIPDPDLEPQKISYTQIPQLRLCHMAFCITCCAYVTSPEANGAEGLCGEAARRSAAEPEAPSEAPMHIRAVMRSDMGHIIRE